MQYGVFFGCLTAYSVTKMLSSTAKRFGNRIAVISGVFMLAAPGLFYSSTSYLPSAVASSLVMLSTANWMINKFGWSIFWGCIAVLATGWPFVGVLFLPIGVHMIVSAVFKAASWQGSVFNLFRLVRMGLILLAIVQAPVTMIDYKYYNKW